MLLGLGGAGLAAVGVGCLLVTVIGVILILSMNGGGADEPPTPTRAITPTLTSIPTPTDTLPPPTEEGGDNGGSSIGNTLYQDDFSSTSSGWEIGDYDTGSVGYRDGAYFVSSVGDGHMMWGIANSYFEDVVVDVDTTQYYGPTDDNNGYGVVCREQSDVNATGYFFLISGDGAYGIVKAVEGEFEWLVDWTFSDEIAMGNATNHLRAICDGTTLALFVNGRRMASTQDSTFSGGDIAMAAVSLVEAEGTEIHFDNVVVSQP
jgi:hypothetical protein